MKFCGSFSFGFFVFWLFSLHTNVQSCSDFVLNSTFGLEKEMVSARTNDGFWYDFTNSHWSSATKHNVPWNARSQLSRVSWLWMEKPIWLYGFECVWDQCRNRWNEWERPFGCIFVSSQLYQIPFAFFFFFSSSPKCFNAKAHCHEPLFVFVGEFCECERSEKKDLKAFNSLNLMSRRLLPVSFGARHWFVDATTELLDPQNQRKSFDLPSRQVVEEKFLKKLPPADQLFPSAQAKDQRTPMPFVDPLDDVRRGKKRSWRFLPSKSFVCDKDVKDTHPSPLAFKKSKSTKKNWQKLLWLEKIFFIFFNIKDDYKATSGATVVGFCKSKLFVDGSCCWICCCCCCETSRRKRELSRKPKKIKTQNSKPTPSI